MRRKTALGALLVFAVCLSRARAAAPEVDLTRAVVVAPQNFTGPENKAVQMLIEEVERRTQVRWERAARAAEGAPVISVGRAADVVRLPREGYRLRAERNGVSVIGNDARGVLFGVGHLLRSMRMSKRRVTLPADLDLATAPKYPLRGHQLGYGARVAMREAGEVLDRAVTERVAQDWRARASELAEALYQSIRMQLSVGKYQAPAVGRGANLDTIDFPLNSRLWLKGRFQDLRGPMPEAERLRRIDEIVNWKNPGPGGFYDDLGKPAEQPRLVRGLGFDRDPSFLASSHVTTANHSDGSRNPVGGDFALVGMGLQPAGPFSWWDMAETYYETPLQMRYTGLDRAARYRVRVVYAGGAMQALIRLTADDQFEVHPLIKKESGPAEFDVPAGATADGELTLTWAQGPGSRGAGRGTQVAEVWLIRKSGAAVKE